MRLYHGSDRAVPSPDVGHSRGNLDFGRGFYLTSFKGQAQRWAQRKAVRTGGAPIVSVYEFDETAGGFDVLRFDENDAAWVEFVCACRRGEPAGEACDPIVGGVANDKVFRAVDMYFRGLWGIERTLEALRFYERNDQYCFASQRMLDETVAFVGSYEVG